MLRVDYRHSFIGVDAIICNLNNILRCGANHIKCFGILVIDSPVWSFTDIFDPLDKFKGSTALFLVNKNLMIPGVIR